jgi:hypothetical protein
MKRLRIPGFIDLFEVSDPVEIESLNSDPDSIGTLMWPHVQSTGFS